MHNKLFLKSRDGYFGEGDLSFGGCFIPEILYPAIMDLQRAYVDIFQSKAFKKEYKTLLKHFVGRPTPLIYAKNASKILNNDIYLKFEGLANTGAHKINNALAQVLLAKKMKKSLVIAETGAGQHGVAVASVCAFLNIPCKIFMGEVDVQRQRPNVFIMEQFGATVTSVSSGTKTLKDAVNETLREWSKDPYGTFYVIGSALGPCPYPDMVRDSQSVIGKEIKKQLYKLLGILPDYVIACVGGGSNAIGAFYPFLEEKKVKLVGVEAGGDNFLQNKNAMRLSANSLAEIGIAQGYKSYFLQDKHGQINETYSISAGLDYAGVGPQLAHLANIKRVKFIAAHDNQALEALRFFARHEGILPALESSHALAGAIKVAKMTNNRTIVVNVSGRGDKDIFITAKELCPEKWKDFLEFEIANVKKKIKNKESTPPLDDTQNTWDNLSELAKNLQDLKTESFKFFDTSLDETDSCADNTESDIADNVCESANTVNMDRQENMSLKIDSQCADTDSESNEAYSDKDSMPLNTNNTESDITQSSNEESHDKKLDFNELKNADMSFLDVADSHGEDSPNANVSSTEPSQFSHTCCSVENFDEETNVLSDKEQVMYSHEGFKENMPQDFNTTCAEESICQSDVKPHEEVVLDSALNFSQDNKEQTSLDSSAGCELQTYMDFDVNLNSYDLDMQKNVLGVDSLMEDKPLDNASTELLESIPLTVSTESSMQDSDSATSILEQDLDDATNEISDHHSLIGSNTQTLDEEFTHELAEEYEIYPLQDSIKESVAQPEFALFSLDCEESQKSSKQDNFIAGDLHDNNTEFNLDSSGVALEDIDKSSESPQHIYNPLLFLDPNLESSEVRTQYVSQLDSTMQLCEEVRLKGLKTDIDDFTDDKLSVQSSDVVSESSALEYIQSPTYLPHSAITDSIEPADMNTCLEVDEQENDECASNQSLLCSELSSSTGESQDSEVVSLVSFDKAILKENDQVKTGTFQTSMEFNKILGKSLKS